MATTSQLSIPPSQNTAPVFKYDCLYTHDLVQKKKRWRDGILAYHTFNKRVMVYDLTSNFIGDTHWREAEPVQVGDDLRLDRGVLVTIGEAKGQKDQDISEIFVRRNAATREPKLPPKKVVLARSVGRKPPALADVLEASRNKSGVTALAHARSSMSIGSSPYDIGSERPPKRQKLAGNGRPARHALVEKPTTNGPSMLTPKDCNQQGSKAPKRARNPPREEENDSELCPTPSKRDTARNSKPIERPRDDQAVEDIVLVGKRKRTERPRDSKTIRAKVPPTVPPKNPSKSDARKTKKPEEAVKVPSKEPSIPIHTNPNQPKQKLMSSKTRRKKLIFQSMSSFETEQASSRPSHSKEPPSELPRSDQARARRCLSPTTVSNSREVIIISSPEKKWTDSEISDDENRRIPRHSRKSPMGNTANVHKTTMPNSAERPNRMSVHKAISGDGLTRDNEDVPDKKSTHDGSDYYGLTAEDNLLAALVEHPIEMQDRGYDPQDTELALRVSDLVNVQSANNPVYNDDMQSISKGARSLIEVPEEEKITLQDVQPKAPLPPQEITKAINHEIPLDITTTSIDATTLPASRTNLVADKASPPISPNNHDQGAVSNPILQSEAVDQANIPSVQSPELPPPKQRALKSIAPIPALLRPTNPILGPITHQKPLPQFRPPQQTSVLGGAAVSTRTRRSPLQKSLSTVANGRPIPAAGDGIASLTRAGSDGSLQTMGVVQKEYDDAGPWSREAFDLFGWTPDMPKGRILGPVAGRGCACRATAAAAVVGGS